MFLNSSYLFFCSNLSAPISEISKLQFFNAQYALWSNSIRRWHAFLYTKQYGFVHIGFLKEVLNSHYPSSNFSDHSHWFDHTDLSKIILELDLWFLSTCLFEDDKALRFNGEHHIFVKPYSRGGCKYDSLYHWLKISVLQNMKITSLGFLPLYKHHLPVTLELLLI